MAEVLKTRDYRKELPPSRTIISLGCIHDSEEKGDGALYSVHHGGEYRAHRDIRRIGVQNESLVWLWVSQSDCLGEGSLQALEGLLGLGRPRETHPFFISAESGSAMLAKFSTNYGNKKQCQKRRAHRGRMLAPANLGWSESSLPEGQCPRRRPCGPEKKCVL